jgi:hypothetical protein
MLMANQNGQNRAPIREFWVNHNTANNPFNALYDLKDNKEEMQVVARLFKKVASWNISKA